MSADQGCVGRFWPRVGCDKVWSHSPTSSPLLIDNPTKGPGLGFRLEINICTTPCLMWDTIFSAGSLALGRTSPKWFLDLGKWMQMLLLGVLFFCSLFAAPAARMRRCLLTLATTLLWSWVPFHGENYQRQWVFPLHIWSLQLLTDVWTVVEETSSSALPVLPPVVLEIDP